MNMHDRQIMFLGESGTREGYFDGSPTKLFVSRPQYIVSSVEGQPSKRKITCWKNGEQVFDVSHELGDLTNSWEIHEMWHEFQSAWAPQSDDASMECQDAFFRTLTEKQNADEAKRQARMEAFRTRT